MFLQGLFGFIGIIGQDGSFGLWVRDEVNFLYKFEFVFGNKFLYGCYLQGVVGGIGVVGEFGVKGEMVIILFILIKIFYFIICFLDID